MKWFILRRVLQDTVPHEQLLSNVLFDSVMKYKRRMDQFLLLEFELSKVASILTNPSLEEPTKCRMRLKHTIMSPIWKSDKEHPCQFYSPFLSSLR